MRDVRRNEGPLRRAGFTLLELAIALALAVVLLALALPNLGSRIARERLVATGRDLAADLMLARHEAAQRGRPVHLVFVPGARWCWALALAESVACDRAAAAADPLLLRAVASADRPGIELADAEPFHIDPRRDAVQRNAGFAEFRNDQGEALRVTLSPIGRASLCVLAGSAGGRLGELPRCAAPVAR